MRSFHFYIFLFLLLGLKTAKAQDSDSLEVYTVSGIGFGFPLGNTADMLRPKISTRMGLDISPKGKAFFIYPSVHLLVFNYDQQEPDPKYPYSIKNGRSSISTLTIAAGIRKKYGNLAVYGFLGPGGGLIKEPRTGLLQNEGQVSIDTHKSWAMALTVGSGIEYRLGQFALFIEGSYLYHFQEIQSRTNHVLPVYGGIKSDISKIFKKQD